MQTIKHDTEHINKVFADIDYCYAVTSDKALSNKIVAPSFDNAFKDVFNLFSRYAGIDFPVSFTDKQYKRMLKVESPGNTIILCFSGGKDSVATALYYKKLKYTVYLYHLRGINKTYKDEWKAAIELAKWLKMPIIIEDCTLSGNHEWTEHPLKNMIIANRALEYGIKNKLTTRIAFGNYVSSRLWDDPFEICAGDTADMWRAYEKIIRRVVPRFKILTPLENIQSAFEAIAQYSDVLPLLQSCIGPYRYREYLHRNNQRKFNIELLPHRCGSCWKCAVEYIWFTDHDIIRYNEAYYKHCLEVLQKTLKQETGYLEKNIDKVWEHYFFYDSDKNFLDAIYNR